MDAIIYTPVQAHVAWRFIEEHHLAELVADAREGLPIELVVNPNPVRIDIEPRFDLTRRPPRYRIARTATAPSGSRYRPDDVRELDPLHLYDLVARWPDAHQAALAV